MEKAWTFYWLDGHKSVLYGETVEQAFNKSYGGGALSAVDFYDEHITSTRYWIPGGKGLAGTWEKKLPYHIAFSDIENMTEEQFVSEMMSKVFPISSEIRIDYETKDVLSIQSKVSLFSPEGYVSIVEVFYGEYFEGRIDGSAGEPGDHFFECCDTEYFRPKDLREALKAFFNRAKSQHPFKAGGSIFSANGSAFSASIIAIAADQDPQDILF